MRLTAARGVRMSPSLMKTQCKVELAEHPYTIHIGPGLLADTGTLCQEASLGGPLLVVTDEKVAPQYADPVEAALRAADYTVARVTVPAGEASKSHTQLIRIYDAALAAGLDRGSSIVALGGGVIGDLAGFAAATYLRGIHYVQVPTTLLAMVDSAVGGKTAVNLPQGKNLIGAFHQPALVIADMDSLTSLPPREWSAGLAEVIKYGVIAEPSLLDILEGHTSESLAADPDTLGDIVQRSCAIKANVVRRDEREGGLRAILNFGHTLGHAIEQLTGYGTFLHGEAIAIGMVYAARLSHKLRAFPADDVDRLIRLLERYGLPVTPPDCDWNAVATALLSDKKKVRGSIGFVLVRQLGVAAYGQKVPPDLLAETWQEML